MIYPRERPDEHKLTFSSVYETFYTLHWRHLSLLNMESMFFGETQERHSRRLINYVGLTYSRVKIIERGPFRQFAGAVIRRVIPFSFWDTDRCMLSMRHEIPASTNKISMARSLIDESMHAEYSGRVRARALRTYLSTISCSALLADSFAESRTPQLPSFSLPRWSGTSKRAAGEACLRKPSPTFLLALKLASARTD